MSKLLRFLASFLFLVAFAACQGTTSTEVAPQDIIIRINKDGVYQITAKMLKAYGWDLARLDTGKIGLSHGIKTPIPFQLVGKGKKQKILFYGHSTKTRYDDAGVYVLHYGALQAIPEFSEKQLSDPSPPITNTFNATIHIEDNITYQAQVADGRPWLGQRLFSPDKVDIAIDTPFPSAGPTQLTINLWAATEGQTDTDHHLIFMLNDEKVGEESWKGKGRHQITLPVPDDILQTNPNKLTISSPGDTGAPADLVYVDWVEVSYPRLLKTEEDRLLFISTPGTFGVEGFQNNNIQVWDVSQPDTPIILDNTRITKRGRTNQVLFTNDTNETRTYIVFTSNGTLSPTQLSYAPTPLNMPSSSVDYIIITHPDLKSAVQPLADWRTKHGLRAMVVTTDQIYLRFSQGLQSTKAITDFLRWSKETWPQPAPRFVLLAGDASYDPLNYLDAPNKNLVPTAFVNTVVMGETASDNFLADIDNDGLPDFAIGRFPAQTPEQLKTMINKTITYETLQTDAGANWKNTITLIADDDDPFFSEFNDDLVQLLPDFFQKDKLVIGKNKDVKKHLIADWNAGRGLISYMGHGALDIWARESIFSSDEISELHQQKHYPIVLVWACLNGYFQHPQQTSLGETLLITPQKGAVAGLFPTGQTFPNDQHMMAEALFKEGLFEQQTIGEALLKAVHALAPNNSGQRDIINTFSLLGDPALKLSFGQ